MTRSLCLLLSTVCVVGLSLVVAPAPPAGAASVSAVQPCSATYESGQLDRAIWRYRTGGIFSDPITVPEMAAPIADLDVTVNIDHDATRELEVSLSKNGLGERFLARHNGYTWGEDFVDTTFDDEAAVHISEGEAPFTGRFRPTDPRWSTPLSFADGAAAGGDWWLRVYDHGYDDEIHPYGTLGSWSMTITYAWCDTDGDGLRDTVDRCARIAARTWSGCPVVGRSLTLRHDGTKFHGRLVSSGTPACHRRRTVNVWRTYDGVTSRVGSVVTGPLGGYRLERPRRKGRYFAVAPGAVIGDAAQCARVRVALS